MSFTGFNQTDFDVFEVPGLEARMSTLIANVRPKLQILGEHLAPFLSVLCGEPMCLHVARHARRKVNPPNDTWVAWSNNKRGYKAHPHFQVGLFSTHLFIQFAIIYESNHKITFANHFEKQLNKTKKAIPDYFFWSLDHTLPQTTLHRKMGKEDFQQVVYKLRHLKNSEVLCGLEVPREDPVLTDGPRLLKLIEDTFSKLLPLYKLSF
ncbi:MAG TPA: DUF1054 domain-containing protein [Bacilli bacterium]